ncbi:MAG: biotin--[acetyl-CoA-carboxylase] ligase [Treponema sp.]|nr:biotin--[acetyl-CoA-carboxylase] ligase [Treponema sp.]
MTTKEKVFDLLNLNAGTSVSGEKLAEVCGISRAAVWKAVKSLRDEGFLIEGATNGGYILKVNTDVLNSLSVKNFLVQKYPEHKKAKIKCFKTIDSTNTYAKKLLSENEKPALDKTVIIAETQTAGRGRLGRSFCSPGKTGIYLSVIYVPSDNKVEPAKITAFSAVAVKRVIERFFDVDAKIKWINDIYVNGKKVVGILTEGFTNFETGVIEAAVIGIGININTKQSQFSKDARKIAGSITNKKDFGISRSQIAAEVAGEVLSIFNEKPQKVIREYQDSSFLMGKTVEVHPIIDDENGVYKAKVIAINEEAELVVKLKNGSIRKLSSGEVTLHQE